MTDHLTQSILMEEQARLERTLLEIDRQMQEIESITGVRREDVIRTRASMWTDLPKVIYSFDDAVVFTQHQQLLDQQEREYVIFRQLLPRLERLRKSAYFGRIDFRRQGERDKISVYIGTASLVETSTGEHLIFDWRAPISSLFYDFEPGPSHYKADAGIVSGDLLLKRQFKIEEDEILYLFDTDVTIEDEMLHSILGRTAESKMQTIVQSIQREQNRAIRDEDHDLLIVLGSAGSGKTSIALHRIAYILYRDRGQISADDIVIISPNDVFSDYISSVLPDLGEENVSKTTFSTLAQKEIKSLNLQSSTDRMEYLFSGKKTDAYKARAKDIAFKGSTGLYLAVKQWAANIISGESIAFETIKWNGRQIISKDELLTLLTETYAYLPFRSRLEKIARRVDFLMEPFTTQRRDEIKKQLINDPNVPHLKERELNRRANQIIAEETAPIKDKVSRFTAFNIMDVYKAMYEDPGKLWESIPSDHRQSLTFNDLKDICVRTLRRLQSGFLRHEDIAPFLCMKALLGDIHPQTGVKHVVIDEVQDYTLFHFEVFRRLFPGATFTVLGDVDQSINLYQPEPDWDIIKAIFNARSPGMIELLTSYRSTAEITRFARAILPREDVTIIEREGEKPTVIPLKNVDEAAEKALSEAIRWQEEGLEMVAVVCKTAAESLVAHEKLQKLIQSQRDHTGKHIPLQLVTGAEDTLGKGIVVLPVYLAKGLEFDGCIIFDAGAQAYPDQEERKLFYTACTRALHRLTLLVKGKPSPLLQAIDEQLYVTDY